MSVFGAGLRPWKRQTETKRAADSSVPGKGELVVSDTGKVYAGDGATQAKNLSPMLRKTDADATYAPKDAAVDPNDIGHDVVLLVGQSNMVGYGNGLDTAYLDTPDARVVQWPGSGSYMGQPVTAVDPLFHHEQFGGGVGHGVGFAKELSRTLPPNRKIMLVPCAHGSTGFSTTSLSSPPAGYTTVSGGSWDTTGAAGGINLYQYAIEQANAAIASGPNNRIVAILWLQGEADTAMTAANYRTALLALIDGLRSNINGASLQTPFLIGQMLDAAIANVGAARQAINAVHIDLPRLRTNTAFYYGPKALIDASYQRGDNLHYSAKGQRVLAVRAFDALARARRNVTGIAAPTLPAPTLSQSGTTANVSWPQPPSRVTDYAVRYSTNGGATWTTLTRAQSIDVTATITGLTLGATALVQVASVNETGTSAWSPSGSITLVALPGQPTALTAGTPAASYVPLSWTAPASGGSVASYLVEYKAHSDSTWIAGPTTSGLSATVAGLADTTQYDFRVSAVNAAGVGTVSSTVSATTAAPSQLLADVGATAYRAYGLRKLSSSYTGAAIQVRRSSDNTTQDIGFAAGSNNLDTTALLSFVGAGSGYISKWYDQSGGGRDLTQSTTSAQARIVNAGVLDTLNGKPAAVFNGSSHFYSDTTVGIWAAGASSMLGVLKVSTPTAFMTLAAEGTTTSQARNALLLLSSGGGQNTVAYNDSAAAIYTPTAGTVFGTTLAHQVSFVDTGSAVSAWQDAAASQSATYSRSGHSMTPNRFTLGAIYFNSTSPSNFWNGYISEVVIFTSALNTTQRQSGEINQKSYFATP